MIFDNVSVLGYSHTNNFLGEKSFAFSSTKNFSIRGYILDLTNFNGVDTVLSIANDLPKEAKEFQNIIINKENFGVGKIKSFSVDPGNWVRLTEYQADIEVLSEVPIQNISSSEFSGLNLTNKNLKLLKSLNESFNIDFDTQNKILGGEHSIDIEYDADNKNIDLIKLAQILASELLKTIPTNLSEANYSTRSNYRIFNSENYNIIDGKAGFKKTFSYSTENVNEPYSINRQQSIEISEDGIATVQESCDIKAESKVPSLYANALKGLNDQIDNSYSRCLSLFNTYKSKFGITRDLNTHAIDKNIKVNKFDGTINYDIKYDNDIKKSSPTYSWERTQTLDRSEEGIWSVSEEGSINGIGKAGYTEKYSNAETGWTIVKSGILSRITSFYNTYAVSKSGTGLKELNKTINKGKYKGNINYNFNYSDDPTVKTSGDVRKVSVDLTDTGLPTIIKNFVIPNNKYTLLQNRNFTNQGTFTVSVKMEIGCISEPFNGKNYFNEAKSYGGFSKRSGFIPTAQDNYLESITFTSDEIEKSVTYEEVYKYS